MHPQGHPRSHSVATPTTRPVHHRKAHCALETTWSAYENATDAYRAPNTRADKALMQAKVNAVTSTRVSNCLTALITLDRTLKHRAGDSRPTSTTPAPPMAVPKPSTVASNTYTAPPSGYETSPTTPPEHSTKMTDSSHNSPNYEEPRMRLRIYKTTFETL